MAEEKSLEFLLFSGDYDAVLSRTGALSDHKRSSNRLEGEDVEDVYRGRGEYTAAPRLPAGLHLALCATGLGAQVNDDSSTEQRWLRVARAGGPKAAAAFGHLVDLHQARVVRLITHLLGRAADAEDVAQEAFVRAFLALPRHPQDAPFWPWIRTIATRLAYNHRRDSGTRQRYEDRVPVCHPANVQSLSDREVLELALGELAYPYREILILKHVEELSIQDIAEQLGLGLSATKMRLSRARTEAIHDRLTK